MLSYAERAKLSKNPTAQKLFRFMADKETNLSLSLDITKKDQLLSLADQLGPKICMLKTHIDIVEDFAPELIEELSHLANKHKFIIFEDRKFADIGNTVKLQYGKGIYQIAKWAQITNAHVLPGPGIIKGLKEIGLPLGNGLLLIAQLSSEHNLFTANYTQTAIQLAESNLDFVIGFICQYRLSDNPGLIHACPGVHISEAGDSLGQRYNTPEKAIAENKNDIIIVGRGIYAAPNPKEAAEKYRKAGWEAYQHK